MIVLDRESNVPLYQQVYAGIVADILSGELPTGTRLHSIRAQAKLINVSISTVEQSYNQLVAEGWIESRRGSGFFVRPVDPSLAQLAQRSPEYLRGLEELRALNEQLFGGGEPEFDFSYSTLEEASVSQKMWSQALKEIPYAPDWPECLHYVHPQGLPRLREELSLYLARENGLAAAPEQIVVSPTARHSIITISRLFDPAHDVVAMEEPGFWEARNALTLCGYHIEPLNVLNGEQAFLENLDAIGPRLIYVTPSNQFPTNRVMSTSTRRALIAWCQEHDAYLIEDNYCYEFRYGIDQLPSLQAQDSSGRVITIGTFSKAAAPALCLGYIVLPPQLMVRLLGKSADWHSSCSFLAQAAMAELMGSGKWEAHLRRLQTQCRRKYQALRGAISAHLGERVNVMDSQAGLHLLIGTRDRRPASELIALARKAGVQVYPTDLYWAGPVSKEWNYVLLGFMSTPEEKIESGIARLAQAWFGE